MEKKYELTDDMIDCKRGSYIATPLLFFATYLNLIQINRVNLLVIKKIKERVHMNNISISEVSRRNNDLNLPCEPIQRVNARVLYESSMKKFNAKNIILATENWRGLHYNENSAFGYVLEMFDAMLEQGTEKDVLKMASLIEAAIPKVRDAKQMQEYIKRRLSHIKTKISTKINNKVDAAKAVTQAVLPKNITPAVQESFERMLEMTNINLQCDRVLNNHQKLAKRFNIDLYVNEHATTKDAIEDCILELCNFIDTYDMPLKVKYNVALENILYAFHKNGIVCESKTIANLTTDYFLMNHANEKEVLREMSIILENNKFYMDLDMQDVSYLIGKNDGQKQFDFFFNSDEDTYSYDETNIKSLDNFVEAAKIDAITEESKAGNKIKEIISSFKLQPVKTPDALKALVNKLYTSSDKNIIDETPNLLHWIFTFFVVAGSLAINPLLAVVAAMTHYLIGMHLQRKECKKMIDSYVKERERANKKLETLKSEEAKERTKAFIKQLDSDIKKLEDYNDELLGDDERYANDAGSDDVDFSFAESFSVNGFTTEDCSIAEGLIAVAKSVDMIDWDEKKVAALIIDNMKVLNLDDIDTMIEFAMDYPDLLNPNKMLEICEDALQEVRHENGAQKYIRIDCLNENIYKLQNYKPKDRSYNEETALAETYDIMIKTNIIREALSNYSSGIINEMSYTNTIKLMIERLKKVASGLSDQEKIMSRTLDASLETMKDKMEKALTQENREAVIKGEILPPASKIIKLAITSGLAWVVNPALAVVGLLGTFAMSAKIRIKERQMVLDELDVELQMVEKYIRLAEEKNDMKALRELLMIQKKLQAQESRLRYKMKIEWNQSTASSTQDRDKN